MADEKEYDPFAGESGLKDDYDGVIVDAWFATSPQYNAGQTLLCYLKIQEEGGDEEEVEQRYACGPDWGSYDGGDTAEHPKGERKGFNNQTAYYGFIAGAMEAGAEDVLRKRSAELGGAGPKAAKLWKGLSFHWEIETRELEVPDNDNPGKRKKVTINRTLPVKFLGERSGMDAAVQSPGQREQSMAEAAMAAPTTPASPTESAQSAAAPMDSPIIPDANGGPLAAIPAELATRVKLLAKTKEYSDWVDEVMALPGALDHATLVAGLGDESFYLGLRG